MRFALIACVAAMMLVLGQVVSSAEETSANPWNDAPAAPPAAPATVAPAPANPSATPAPAPTAPPAAEPEAGPAPAAPPAATAAAPDPKVVAGLYRTNNQLLKRYSDDSAAIVKLKSEEIVRKYQPLLVAAAVKFEELTKALPTADRAGWDAESRKKLREAATAEILIVQLVMEVIVKLRDAEVAAVVAAGRAKTLRLRKVFEDHKRALDTGHLLTGDAMEEHFDAAVAEPSSGQTAQGKAPSEDSELSRCTVLNPTPYAVDFEMGSGADKIAGRIPSRTHVEFRMKKGQQQLIAKVYPDPRARPLNAMVMVERATLLVFWSGGTKELRVYDRTSEILPTAAGSTAPGGAPVPQMEAKRGVMPPSNAPQPK